MKRADQPAGPLRPAEAARLLGVCVKTLSRWADAGRIEHVLTPGGHRRYPVHAVKALLQPTTHESRSA